MLLSLAFVFSPSTHLTNRRLRRPAVLRCDGRYESTVLQWPLAGHYLPAFDADSTKTIAAIARGPVYAYDQIERALDDLSTGGCDAFMKLAPITARFDFSPWVRCVWRSPIGSSRKWCSPTGA
jgi:hypothetical protein